MTQGKSNTRLSLRKSTGQNGRSFERYIRAGEPSWRFSLTFEYLSAISIYRYLSHPLGLSIIAQGFLSIPFVVSDSLLS
jgi:hypothetical protein